MKAAASIINQLDQTAISKIEQEGTFQLNIDDQVYELERVDFDISADEIPGWQVATDGDITVALDISITEILKKEGIAREIVNRIQNIRKQSDFDVTDRITVTLSEHTVVEPAVSAFDDYIKNEVLADTISFSTQVGGEEVDLIEDIRVNIDVRKN